MSHVVAIKTELRDLAAVKAACDELGFTFKEGQKSFRWFGQWMNDFDREDAAHKLGIKPEDYGKCAHAITIPGSNYDVGLIHNPATGGFRICFDFWGSNGARIQKAIGDGGERLLQHYGFHKAKAELTKRGFSVSRTNEGNKIKLVATQL